TMPARPSKRNSGGSAEAEQPGGVAADQLLDVVVGVAEVHAQLDDGPEAGDRRRVLDLPEIGAEDRAVERAGSDHRLELIGLEVLEARLVDEHAQRVLDIG